MSQPILFVEHDYYCSESNYHVGGQPTIFETVDDFLEEYGYGKDVSDDVDMNLCFRFDVKDRGKDEGDEPTGDYYAQVFLIHQRKGNFNPITINKYTAQDDEKMVEWLKPHWAKLKQIWTPISK